MYKRVVLYEERVVVKILYYYGRWCLSNKLNLGIYESVKYSV